MGGSDGYNIFNTGVNKNIRPLFMVLDPGGGLAQTIGMVGGEKATSKLMTQEPAIESQTPEVEVPKDENAAAASRAAAKNKQRRMAKSQTVYTSPLGLADESTISKKVLTGS